MTDASSPPVGMIFLNGKSYPVSHEQYHQLATFPPKVTQGDPTRDSDHLISSKIWTDFTGGIGVRNIREGADEGGFYFGTLDGSKPFQLALSRRHELIDETILYAIGTRAGTFYGATATTLHAWNESTLSFGSSVGTLTSTPAGKGIEFNGKLFIPQGDGYQTWDGATVATQVTTYDIIAFTEWNNWLWAITSDGRLLQNEFGTDTGWAPVTQLHSSVQPRNIAVYMDDSGNDAIFISTDRGIYAWDHYASVLIKTRLKVPPYPYNGYGMAHWRLGEDLFVTNGLQVARFTGDVIVPDMGPTKPNGLPSTYRGYIKDLEPELNAMYALVQGVEQNVTADPSVAFDSGMVDEGEFTSVETIANSLLLRWTEKGWHVVWESPSALTPYWSMVSSAEEYRIWWGTSAGIFSIILPRSIENPRELMEAGEGLFNQTGYIQFGNYDAGMRRFEKIASHFELVFSEWPAGVTVAAEYNINETGWVSFTGSMTPDADGLIRLPFGVQTESDGKQFSYGVIFDRIDFKLTFTGTSTQSPIMDSAVLKFIKRPLQTSNFIVDILIDFDEFWDLGRTALDMKRELDEMSNSPSFVRYQHGSDPHNSHRVYVSRVQGANETGENYKGARSISLIEVPLDSYDGN